MRAACSPGMQRSPLPQRLLGKWEEMAIETAWLELEENQWGRGVEVMSRIWHHVSDRGEGDITCTSCVPGVWYHARVTSHHHEELSKARLQWPVASLSRSEEADHWSCAALGLLHPLNIMSAWPSPHRYGGGQTPQPYRVGTSGFYGQSHMPPEGRWPRQSCEGQAREIWIQIPGLRPNFSYWWQTF